MGMQVAKIMEITAESPENFEHAMRMGLERAAKTVKNIQGAWIKEQKIIMKDNKVSAFRVDMKVTFILND